LGLLKGVGVYFQDSGRRSDEDLLIMGSGMTTSFDMYYLKKVDANFTYPGGQLWDGEKLIEDKPVLS